MGLRRLLRLDGSLAVFLLSIMLAATILPSSPLVAADGSGPAEATGFNVLTANWGAAGSAVSVSPGSQYVPLTISLQYFFANTATAIQLTLTMPPGFTDANGAPVSVAFVSGSVTSGSTVTSTFYLNVSPSVSTGTYFFPLAINWGAQLSQQQSVALVQHTYATVYLKGKAQLGFSAAQDSLLPGQVNSVRFTLSNSGSGPATQIITTTVASGSALSLLTAFPTIASLAPNSNFSSTMRIFVPSSAAGSAMGITFTSAYVDSNGNAATVSQTVGLYSVSVIATSAANSLSVTTMSNSLLAGAKSLVAFSIKNTGQQAVYAPTISLATASPLVVTINSSVALGTTVLSPGETLPYSAEVTTGTGASGGFYTGTLTITFTDQFGGSYSQNFPVAFYVTAPVIQVSASSVLSQISIGKSSMVSFMIINSGTAPVYSPSFSLTVPSGIAVVSNSTFSTNGLVLTPGERVKYSANVTTGPKTAEGAYVATLTVGYLDQFGNAHSSTFSMGLVAVGGIQLVLQNERFSANGTSYSLTGTLLNEGLANAFYTEVTATLTAGTRQLATASTYVGEVDVNTPLPVSVAGTIPEGALASANGTGTLTFTASYQNDFGQALQFKTSERVSLSTGAPTGISTGATTTQVTFSAQSVDYIRYGGLIAIFIVAIVTVAYVRRGRSRGKRATSQKSDVY